MAFKVDVLRAGKIGGMRVSREGRRLTVECWIGGEPAPQERKWLRQGAVVSVQGR